MALPKVPWGIEWDSPYEDGNPLILPPPVPPQVGSIAPYDVDGLVSETLSAIPEAEPSYTPGSERVLIPQITHYTIDSNNLNGTIVVTTDVNGVYLNGDAGYPFEFDEISWRYLKFVGHVPSTHYYTSETDTFVENIYVTEGATTLTEEESYPFLNLTDFNPSGDATKEDTLTLTAYASDFDTEDTPSLYQVSGTWTIVTLNDFDFATTKIDEIINGTPSYPLVTYGDKVTEDSSYFPLGTFPNTLYPVSTFPYSKPFPRGWKSNIFASGTYPIVTFPCGFWQTNERVN